MTDHTQGRSAVCQKIGVGQLHRFLSPKPRLTTSCVSPVGKWVQDQKERSNMVKRITLRSSVDRRRSFWNFIPPKNVVLMQQWHISVYKFPIKPNKSHQTHTDKTSAGMYILSCSQKVPCDNGINPFLVSAVKSYSGTDGQTHGGNGRNYNNNIY